MLRTKRCWLTCCRRTMTTTTTNTLVNLDKALQMSIDLAYEAGKIALFYCNKRELLAIETKTDESPVTIADKKVNEYIVDKLQAAFPQARVIGEESVKNTTQDLAKGAVFFVDPIDGTKEFIKNNGEWAVMIGLNIDAIPMVGVVYRAAADQMYYAARGQGSYVVKKFGAEPQKLVANKPKSLAECTFLTSRSHNHPNVKSFMQQVGVTKELTVGSFGIKCAYIAEGLGDVYVNPSLATHYWDSCASDVILHEAGATLLTSQVQPIAYDGLDTRIKYNMIAFPASLDTQQVMQSLNAHIKL